MPTRALAIAIALAIAPLLGAGCGAGGSKTEATPTQPPPTVSAVDLSQADRETELAAAETPLLPVFNQAALAARVAAQRAALGRGATLFEDGTGRAVPWISPQTEEVGDLDDDILDSLPGSSGLGGGGVTGPAVNGNALGLFTPIEPEEASESPLARFHAALRRLEAGNDPDGKVRVLVYGGSHTDADVYPHYVRRYLQERFGDGGHGFVQIAKPWKWYHHIDVEVEGLAKWITEHAQRRSGRDDGLYGLLGASLSTKSKKAFGRVTLREGTVGSQFEVHYLEQPKGGSFDLLADGKRIATIKTRTKETGPGFHAFTLPEDEHTIEIKPRGNGEVRLFGMTVEREQSGVVVDTLGIGGTRAANWLEWDERVWGEAVRRRAPDLVTLFYGTNEATDAHQDIATYESDLRAVLEKLGRVAPQAACLLMGPGDFPRHSGETWVARPRVSEIVHVQRRVAREMGCGFWDTRAFMGGELSMVKWARARPTMARGDHIHFTRRGYTRIGMGVVDAIMVEFDGDPLQGSPGAQ